MYYHIDKIRCFTLNRIPATDVDRKWAVQKFMMTKNLVEMGIVRNIYVNDFALYINEETFINYMNVLYKQFGFKVKYAGYAKCHVSECDDSFIVETVEQLREIEERRKVVNTQKKKEHAAKMSLLNQPLPTDLEDKKLMAIDFEYIPNGNDVEPVEMGISIQHNGMRTSFNYSFVNTQKENFNFGDTINVDKSQVLNIFKEHFVDVDYLVGHDIMAELRILKLCGLEDNFLENIKFIDTATVTRNEFHFLNCDHVKNQAASLRTSLRTFGVPYVYLHVAGNDASYTLDVLNHLVAYKSNFERKTAKQKIQVNSVFKKQKK